MVDAASVEAYCRVSSDATLVDRVGFFSVIVGVEFALSRRVFFFYVQ